jgi:hypothetical protein
MSDILGKMQGDQNILEKIVSKIPGFSGYLEKERRRDADRLLREEITRAYAVQLSRLNNLPAEMLDAGQINLLDDLDRARTRLQTFIDRVRTASYGYAGLFDAVKVNEDDLQKLYNFDAGLLDGTTRLGGAIDAVAAPERNAAAIGALITVTDELNTTFSQREAIIKGTPQ